MYLLTLLAWIVNTYVGLAVLLVLPFVTLAAADDQRNPLAINFRVIGGRAVRYIVTAIILGIILVISNPADIGERILHRRQARAPHHLVVLGTARFVVPDCTRADLPQHASRCGQVRLVGDVVGHRLLIGEVQPRPALRIRGSTWRTWPQPERDAPKSVACIWSHPMSRSSRACSSDSTPLATTTQPKSWATWNDTALTMVESFASSPRPSTNDRSTFRTSGQASAQGREAGESSAEVVNSHMDAIGAQAAQRDQCGTSGINGGTFGDLQA